MKYAIDNAGNLVLMTTGHEKQQLQRQMKKEGTLKDFSNKELFEELLKRGRECYKAEAQVSRGDCLGNFIYPYLSNTKDVLEISATILEEWNQHDLCAKVRALK